jgi:crossover junction endodeoxyribonuclease RuvC
MRVLGIDPGTHITGYGLVQKDGQRLSAVDFGIIKTDAATPMPERLKTIYDNLYALIQKHQPKELALETAFLGKNIQSALKLGQARGAVMILAMNTGLRFAEYSPREVKQAVTGGGSAAKEQVAFMVKKILNVSELPVFLDASDALALAICHCNRTGVAGGAKFKDWKSFITANPDRVKS